MANLDWYTHHWSTEGKPNGGQSYGIGFCIAWQRGSLVDQGRNGAFLTDVLEVCLDELKHKDSYFSSKENLPAIQDLESCLKHLNNRTNRRQLEGTLGTHLPDTASD